MNQYKKEIEDLTLEKDKYEILKPKLSEISSRLPELSDKLAESERLYKNGGFMSGEETYDRGVLKECYTKVDNDISTVSDAINKVTNKIDELESKIRTAKNNLESATSNYHIALKKEREGE
jgi:chaperonin cofactor prefoldin